MVVEILFSELYIYGEKANAEFFGKVMESKGCEVHYTSFLDEPVFTKKNVDIILMLPMSEKWVDKAIIKLLPYTSKLKELKKKGTYFLLFGNAMDIFAKKLILVNDVFDILEGKNISENEKEVDTIALTNYISKRDYTKRIYGMSAGVNSEIILPILGSKLTFSEYECDNYEKYYWFNLLKGKGFNDSSEYGSYREENIFACEIIGCLFIVCPHFLKYFLKLWKLDLSLPNEKILENAFLEKKELWIKYKKIDKKL